MARGKLAARQGAAAKQGKTASAVGAGAHNAQGKRGKVGHLAILIFIITKE